MIFYLERTQVYLIKSKRFISIGRRLYVCISDCCFENCFLNILQILIVCSTYLWSLVWHQSECQQTHRDGWGVTFLAPQLSISKHSKQYKMITKIHSNRCENNLTFDKHLGLTFRAHYIRCISWCNGFPLLRICVNWNVSNVSIQN